MKHIVALSVNNPDRIATLFEVFAWNWHLRQAQERTRRTKRFRHSTINTAVFLKRVMETWGYRFTF